MKKKMEDAGIHPAEVDSAGTGAWHAGEAPDKRSVAVAKKYGLDISEQCARQFHKNDFEKFDYIFAMDESNYKDILSHTTSKTQREKVHLFLRFAGIYEPVNVPDPWYGGPADFEKVYHLLDKACSQVVSRLLQKENKS